MIRSSFFNSIGGDRKYDASKFAEYFNSFIGNGVFPTPLDGLQVISNDDMTVTVKEGKAWINGYIMINDDDYILPIDVADGLLKRIDRVVVRLDTTDREIRVEVKKGTFASVPVAPSLQRDADAYELGIADILISNGVISIIQANITDLRSDTEFCGKVDSLIAGDINSLVADLEAHKADNTHSITEITNITINNTTTPAISISVDDDYDFFVLEMLMISTSSSNETQMIFNDDNGINYADNTPGGGDNQSKIRLRIPFNAYTTEPKICTIRISNLQYFEKTYSGHYEMDFVGTISTPSIPIRGKWKNTTDRINNITIGASSGNIGQGSKFRLLGVK